MSHVRELLQRYIKDVSQSPDERYDPLNPFDVIDELQKAIEQDEEENRWIPVKENGWIPVSERLPIAEPVHISLLNSKYESKKVIVQTKRGEVFAAKYVKRVYINKDFKDEETWYTYGTGGRQMRVMSKVIAWMPLPKPYKEETNNV